MMRGYFAIGAEGLSKPMNFGNLMRSAHAFGASFVFTVDATREIGRVLSDTSRSAEHVPYYAWKSIDEMELPKKCSLVGVELMEGAIDLPSFRHPPQAAYVLGPEQGSLSDEMLERCDFTIKIPTRFCINVATTGAIVMYDRMRVFGKFAPRPVRAGAPTEERAEPVHGKPLFRGGKPA